MPVYEKDNLLPISVKKALKRDTRTNSSSTILVEDDGLYIHRFMRSELISEVS
ncbi:MAG: hypothetical protein L0H53_10800 [Candidatus Nitrosocosmicus sp.]|nr:hypothetical protein [Candidatus Nitrosocosmicus sp.]